MDLIIRTLNNPRSLRLNEDRKERSLDVRSFTTGALTSAVVLGLLGGFTIRSLKNEPTSDPSKLDIPATAVVSILDAAEAAQPQQVKQTWDIPLTGEELAVLLETCEAGCIDPTIALGLIQVESSFDPDALNAKSGCYGYCQLNPLYFPAELSPVENIQTGIEYLAYQLERYDDLEAALTAYNAGHDTGSRTYAAKVLEAAATFERR